ncbi:MAG TPA: glycosyltransferase, partial [Phycisphaerales bacterium]|nr:glycosyltransferase [Phycisphaerales bacterium]
MEQHGLEYGYMNDELLGILDTDQGRDLMENTTGIFQVIKQTLTMLKRLGPMQRSLFQDGWEATKRSQPHLIIF